MKQRPREAVDISRAWTRSLRLSEAVRQNLTLAVVLPQLQNPFYAELLAAIDTAADQREINTTFF